LITHQESFPLGCGDKPLVEADEFERRRSALGCEKGGGELEGISSTKRMDPKQTPSSFEDRVDWLNTMPMPGERIQAFEGVGYLPGRELVLPFESGEG
jgi:hypothetical protein